MIDRAAPAFTAVQQHNVQQGQRDEAQYELEQRVKKAAQQPGEEQQQPGGHRQDKPAARRRQRDGGEHLHFGLHTQLDARRHAE